MTSGKLSGAVAAMVASLLVVACPARGQEGNANSRLVSYPAYPDGPDVPLQLRIETDKAIYHTGETVEMLSTITNLGAVEIWYDSILHPALNLRAREGPTTVWTAFETPPVDEWPPRTGVGISAGGVVELRYDWPMEDDVGEFVRPGLYEIEGLFGWAAIPILGDEGQVIGIVESGHVVGVPIEVIPEPGTFALLLAGVAVLAHRGAGGQPLQPWFCRGEPG